MAATCVAGINGSVTLPTHKIKARAWSLSIFQDFNDSTGFSSTGDWREGLAGLKGARGAISGYLEFDDASTAPAFSTPASGSFTLTATTGCTYTFSGVVTSCSVSHSVDGNLSANVEFSVNGAVTETWDETA